MNSPCQYFLRYLAKVVAVGKSIAIRNVLRHLLDDTYLDLFVDGSLKYRAALTMLQAAIDACTVCDVNRCRAFSPKWGCLPAPPRVAVGLRKGRTRKS